MEALKGGLTMTTKMTKEERQRKWAKLAVKASEQTGEPLPNDFYERTGMRPPMNNRFRTRVSRRTSPARTDNNR